MKINLEVDVPPEELRRFFGLPDLEPIQQEMLAHIKKQMELSADPAYYSKMAYQFATSGAQSMETFQKAFYDLLTNSSSSKK